MRLSRCLALCLATLTLTGSSFADITAALHLGGGTLTSGIVRSIGWEFTVSIPVSVTALGVWDEGGNGLGKIHQIGVFRVSDAALIVGAMLVDGASSPLIDGTRFVDVLPTPLVPGINYYILADEFSTDAYVSGNGSIGFASHVNWLAVADTAANSIFGAPAFTPGTVGNLGPNFRYTVPGPGALGLLAFGGFLMGAKRRKA